MSRNAILRGIVGIAVSAIAIYLLVRSVDLAATLDVLRTAAPIWIALMLVTASVDLGARAARWQILLGPIARLPYRRVLGYTYIGYLANNVLPARLGELYRSHALGEGEGISRPTVLGTVVVERIVDTVMVVAIAAAAVVVLSVRGVIANAVILGFAFVTLLVVALGVGMAAHRLPGAERIVALAERWPLVLELARRLRQGLAVASRPRTLVGALAFSAVAWAASITTFLAAGQAIGIELTLAQAALMTSGVA
ncbi:MAG: flippase-like domain-containing protein, partial [Chloroflexi bacterium]|nr:flippase-like domain-containing protein [Chloroflexota bacterium]